MPNNTIRLLFFCDVRYIIKFHHRIGSIKKDCRIYPDIITICFDKLYEGIAFEISFMFVFPYPEFNLSPVHRHPFIPDRNPFARRVRFRIAVSNRNTFVGSEHCGIHNKKKHGQQISYRRNHFKPYKTPVPNRKIYNSALAGYIEKFIFLAKKGRNYGWHYIRNRRQERCRTDS